VTPLDYHQRGWRIVPIPAGQKRPAMQGWPDFKARSEDVPRLFDCKNIAVIVGARSGDLVDIDLDCAEGVALADLYLPATQAEFGRASKPRSHRLYIAPGATFEAFADPLLEAKNTLLEQRADGRTGGADLTLLPPSIAGERRQWHRSEPAMVTAAALRGGRAITAFINELLKPAKLSEDAVYRLADKRRKRPLPGGKVCGQLIASPAKVRAYFEMLANRGDGGDDPAVEMTTHGITELSRR
jgi:hypothetical protein